MIECKNCGSKDVGTDFLYHDRDPQDPGYWLFVCYNCDFFLELREESLENRRKIENGSYDISYSHLIWSRNLFQKALGLAKLPFIFTN